MQTVSSEFTTASTATIRKPIGKVRILWNDVYVDPTTVAASTDENEVSWTNQVYDGMETTPHKYAILDGTWTLDDEPDYNLKYLAPGTQSEANVNQFGWYSESVADGSGDFTSPVVLTVTFPSRTVDALKIVGEPTLEQYPVDFTLHITNLAVEYLVATITGNTLVNYDIDISALSYFDSTQIKLTVTKWSTPNTILKIVEFFSVVIDTFEGDDIVSMQLLEEREISKGSLPVGNISCNELTLELQNVKRIKYGTVYNDPFSYGNTASPWHNLIVTNRRITAYLGFNTSTGDEYVPVGTFWTGDWTNKDDSFSVTVTCRDRMEILRRSTYQGEYILINKSIGYLINYLLEKARDNIPLPDLTWEFSPTEAEGNTLFNYNVPISWFEKDNFMALLRQLVEVGLGQAYMSKNDVLIIEDWNAYTGIEIPNLSLTPSNYFSKDLPENSDDLSNIIQVNVRSLIASDEATTVYNDEVYRTIEASTTDDITVVYNTSPASNVTIELLDETTGVTMTVTNSNTFSANLHIVNSAGTAGAYKIKVDGIEYSYKTVVPIEVRDPISVFQYGEKTYPYPDNQFVQDPVVGNAIANQLLLIYKQLRKDLSINWRGNPALELGDTIAVPVYWKLPDIKSKYVVFKNNIKYDGGLQCSTNARLTTYYS